jgi:uncharacterized protein YndB with AHSA1/START domain
MSRETFDLRVERTFDAPREAVFRAWTTPDLIKQWMHPADDWSTPVAECDLRVGGQYRWGIRSPELGTFYEVGVFQEVEPPERLVFTCRFECDDFSGDMPQEETRVTVEFQDLGERTHVILSQSGYLEAADRDAHQNGWPAFLATLAKLVEGGAA